MRFSNIALAISLGVALLAPTCAQAQWSWTTNAMKYDASHLVTPDLQAELQGASDLSGDLKDRKQPRILGWFEYNFSVPSTGWYVLSLKGGSVSEYILDPHDGQLNPTCTTSAGNLFMNAGKHTLRLQTMVKAGFDRIKSLTITQSDGSVAQTFQANISNGMTKLLAGSQIPLTISSGGRTSSGKLTVVVRDFSPDVVYQFVNGYVHKTPRLEPHSGGDIVYHTDVTLPASEGLTSQTICIPATGHGSFTISFLDGQNVVGSANVQAIGYDVIAVPKSAPAGDQAKRTLIQTIDCASQAPDYEGGVPFHGVRSRVVTSVAGTYRESGLLGYRDHEDATTPNWFAYTLNIDEVQKPYMIEVDYPDDALRNFAIALRESEPGAYTFTGGVDCGGEFSLSYKLQTETLMFWPRSPKTRIVLFNDADGTRAAAARIRLYRVDEPLPAMPNVSNSSRMMANWYEEGISFTDQWGIPWSDFDSFKPGPGVPPVGDRNTETAAARWTTAAAYLGVNTLMPAVNVYGIVLYPSSVDKLNGSPAGDDVLGEIMANAQARGIKVIPELFPRCDELAWYTAYSCDPSQYLLRDLNGTFGHFQAANPLFPANQQWILNVLGEVADRYKDSPALAGVCLHVANWGNSGFDNFVNLDQGYDDYTIGRYKADTKSAIPFVPGDGKYHDRHDWLLANERQQWITWRCEQITKVLAGIVERVRKARPDLNVYINYIGNSGGFNPPVDADPRNAGLDPGMLRSIPGLILLDARSNYGRCSIQAVENEWDYRNFQLDPAKTHEFQGDDAPGKFLATQQYIEGIPDVLPPENLGFDKNVIRRWMSGDVVPSGRHDLERYAVALAETDAFFMGDGGNGYTIGRPVLRDWLREYHCLPAQMFTRTPCPCDPAVVRSLTKGDTLLFYAVNRERFPVHVEISLAGLKSLHRASTGQPVAASKGHLSVSLEPYELIVYAANPGASITNVAETIPVKDMQQVVKQVQWLSVLAKTPPATVTGDQVAVIGKYASQASAALDNRQYWLARTTLERPELLRVLASLNTLPPDLYAPVNSLYEAVDLTLSGTAQLQDGQVVVGLTNPGASAMIEHLQGFYGGQHKIVIRYRALSDAKLTIVANDAQPVPVDLPKSESGVASVDVSLRPRVKNRLTIAGASPATAAIDGLAVYSIEVR
ncbi:MAG: family 10 glycosylhydrolase [Capsulimonadaceae bacterium]|nr:family 10 glycosylhydrolase [Capsulimonadaceae bacterium]